MPTSSTAAIYQDELDEVRSWKEGGRHCTGVRTYNILLNTGAAATMCGSFSPLESLRRYATALCISLWHFGLTLFQTRALNSPWVSHRIFSLGRDNFPLIPS